MIKIKETEAIRQHMRRQKETKEEKINRLQNNRKFIKELRKKNENKQKNKKFNNIGMSTDIEKQILLL